MKTAVFIAIVVVCLELVAAQWTGSLSGSRDSSGNWGLSGGVQHTGRRWSANLGGSLSSGGGWGVSAGVSFRFRKRSIDWNGKHYSLIFSVDPCNFHVYDVNRDGHITKEDILSLFGEGPEAENFFDNLNITTDDNVVDEDEFNYMAPLIIEGCKSTDEISQSV